MTSVQGATGEIDPRRATIDVSSQDVTGNGRRRLIGQFVERLTNWFLKANGLGLISEPVSSALAWMAIKATDASIEAGANLLKILKQAPSRVPDLNLGNTAEVLSSQVASLFRGLGGTGTETKTA